MERCEAESRTCAETDLDAQLHMAEAYTREALQRLADLESRMQAERDDGGVAKIASVIVALHLQVKSAAKSGSW